MSGTSDGARRGWDSRHGHLDRLADVAHAHMSVNPDDNGSDISSNTKARIQKYLASQHFKNLNRDNKQNQQFTLKRH